MYISGMLKCRQTFATCSAHMILLLVVVFITRYEKDKVGLSAGIDRPIVPGMMFGYHMMSFYLPLKGVCEQVILIKCLLHVT
jgi:hypothetical protein